MDVLTFISGGLIGAGLAKLATKMREYKTASEGVSDLLPWESVVDEGVVMQADGALLAGWTYQGGDMEGATVNERNVLSQHLNDALMPFADGWMFHIDAIRRPASRYARPGHFPDPVTRMIDEERRQAYEGRKGDRGTSGGDQAGLYETDYVLVATYLPASGTYDQIGRFFVRGRDEIQAGIDEIIANFARHTDAIENRLGAHLRMQRLGTGELLRHLHHCLTGERHPVAIPPVNISLGTYLADQQIFGGFEPRVGPVHGGKHIRCVSVQGFPNATTQGMLDSLHNGPFVYRWSTRLIMLSDAVASRTIKSRQLQWFKKRKGAAQHIRQMAGNKPSVEQQRNEEEFFNDQAAADMTRDSAAALKRIGASTEYFCIYTSTLVIMHEDREEADRTATALQKILVQNGFLARFEDLNAFEAYLGSLPGNGWANQRRLVVHSRNVSDLVPATKIWAGNRTSASHLFPEDSPALLWTATAGATPFRVNLHSTGDVGHTLIVGATGAGKSVLVNTMLAQWRRYRDAQVFLFDVGGSGYLLAEAVGGIHHDLAPGEDMDLGLQPLSRIDREAERMWATGWLETLLDLSGVPMTPEKRSEIGRALRILAQDPMKMRTLSNLRIQVQDADIREALREFCRGETYGHLLDGSSDFSSDDSREQLAYRVFELSQIRELSPAVFIPILLYLFRVVERQLSADRPTIIVLEEVWSALMESRFADRIKQWLLTLRKQNAAVVLVAHTPAQIAELDNREIIVDSCPTKIYLPNPEASDPESVKLYRSMGLNDREIHIIARATKKKHYFFKCPLGSRLFDLDLGPTALAFVTPPSGISFEALKERVAEMKDAYGPNWVYRWLEERTARGSQDASPQAVTAQHAPRNGREGSEPSIGTDQSFNAQWGQGGPHVSPGSTRRTVSQTHGAGPYPLSNPRGE
jgi:type IV secretion system protein VirB4